MTEKTVKGKHVVFVIMGIVMAAVVVTVLLSDVRDAIHQSVNADSSPSKK